MTLCWGSDWRSLFKLRPPPWRSLRAWPLEGQRPAVTNSSRMGRPSPSSLAFSISTVGTSPTISLKVLSAMPSRPPPNRILLACCASSVAVSFFHLAVWLGVGLPYWKWLGWW